MEQQKAQNQSTENYVELSLGSELHNSIYTTAPITHKHIFEHDSDDFNCPIHVKSKNGKPTNEYNTFYLENNNAIRLNDEGTDLIAFYYSFDSRNKPENDVYFISIPSSIFPDNNKLNQISCFDKAVLIVG